MRKWIAGLVILGSLSIYLVLQNSHLKNEVVLLQEFIEQEDEIENLRFHEDAEKIARSFIEGYFIYERQPEREQVEPYATEQALSQLQFNQHEELDNQDSSILSNVNQLAVYFGQSLDDRQELFAVFGNEIKYDGEASEAHTLMKLDMAINEGEWKVDDFTFTQY